MVGRDAIYPFDAVPSEHDVAGRLHETLPFNDPLSMVSELALGGPLLKYRCLGLFDLEEQGIVLILSEGQRHPATGSDAAHPDPLAGEIDKSVTIEKVSAVLGQRVPVSAQRTENRVFHLLCPYS